MTRTSKPVVCIPANTFDYSGSPGHIVRDTYVKALIDIAGCIPFIIPASGAAFSLEDIKDRIDGILLTGSVSNVAPACYGAEQSFDDSLLDTARDATTLPLIRAAVAADIPLIAVCRGMQEMNVAFGGTLHQNIHEIAGKKDHRMMPPKDMPLLQAMMRPAHAVTRHDGGVFEKWNVPQSFEVNSVHSQGIDRLGEGLTVEAVSDDGIIEAVSVAGKRYALGVQWHPEMDHSINAASKIMFEEFGRAIRDRS